MIHGAEGTGERVRGGGGRDHGAEGAITVHSMGGLGNQLFLYAAGLAAARSSGARLRVDTSQHVRGADRSFELERLGLPAEYVDLGLSGPSYGWRSVLRPRGLRRGCSYVEEVMRHDPAVLAQPAGGCLFGHFQTARYVEVVREAMREQIARIGRSQSAAVGALGDQIAGSRGIVLHVRRGDYAHPAATQWHGLVSPDFYERAVATMRRMGFDGPVFVFSDDLPAVMTELAAITGLTPMSRPAHTMVEDLILMTRAPALVTGNSSFSWWAGWALEDRSAPVVSPRPWFADTTLDSRDLLPAHWLTLDGRGESGG